MADTFHSHIKRSLADKNLQSALDANAERRHRVRTEAFASLVNPDELRKRAHAVRSDVIEHLDSYVEQFATQASNNGMQIHFATDAAQANKIILDISMQRGAKLIAKSKTMVSEETGLNHELEKHGLRVVETDLGEYIVQLRGETPSHIITPAVHLRRQDVGRLFEEKLGLPYTEDIGLMTNTARRTLRQVFLDADIGISGVNLGVAETGMICVVTNEGNGRMVTTVPRIHIALMGIERIVPTTEDLALMLSLLPRSSTGQKLSVYTNLLSSPQRADDPDGPEQRHLILLDNGRKRVRESELREILYCIRCGACLNACPVFREIGGHAYVGIDGEHNPYPGPVGSVVSSALFGQDIFGHLARASTLCGACREACPVDIDLPKLLLRVRAGMGAGISRDKARPNAPGALRTGMDLYSYVAESPKRFAFAQRIGGKLGSVLQRINRGETWIHLPAFSGWGYSKDFPLPPARSFRSRHIKGPYLEGEEDKGLVESNYAIPTNSFEIGEKPHREGERTHRFANELIALGGKFSLCRVEEVAQKVLEILQANGLTDIMAWEATELPEGVVEALSMEGIQIRYPNANTILESSQIRAGLTGSAAGTAETGSILVTGGPGKPLSASLLPEIHIALLWEKDILENLNQLLKLAAEKRESAAVIISGPSRTADIEMALTIGVHGPGELHVICIAEGQNLNKPD